MKHDLNNHTWRPPARQRGVSLLMVMVMMLLSSLLVLGGSRVSLMSEFLAGNDTDYQRAFEAAQILIRDAELDIQNTPANLRSAQFSKKDSELILDLIDLAEAAGTPACANGVCINLGNRTSGDPTTSFWTSPTRLANMTPRGAFYGQFTAAPISGTNLNPILAASNPRRGWYWIEILPYSGRSAEWARDCAPSKGSPQFLYRITAVALGRSDAPAVVQEYFTPKPEGETRRCIL